MTETLYHGTYIENFQDILRRGLVPTHMMDKNPKANFRESFPVRESDGTKLSDLDREIIEIIKIRSRNYFSKHTGLYVSEENPWTWDDEICHDFFIRMNYPFREKGKKLSLREHDIVKSNPINFNSSPIYVESSNEIILYSQTISPKYFKSIEIPEDSRVIPQELERVLDEHGIELPIGQLEPVSQ